MSDATQDPESPGIVRGKAETLAWLSSIGFPVPALVHFSVSEWRREPRTVLEKIVDLGREAGLAIRSSARNEDGDENSMAGMYDSVLDVPAHDVDAIVDAVEMIAAQFEDAEDRILVQKMVGDVIMSGVVTTHALADGTPYYVVNYDDTSGRTDTVTGGKGAVKTVYIYRGAQEEFFDSPRLRIVVKAARELEKHFRGIPLDIEFAVDSALGLHLLQVRPISSRRYWNAAHGNGVDEHIGHVAAFIRNVMSPRPGLFGQRTILGVMPDWNPAEMIGISPRPLAFSLYRELITRRAWSVAREAMGYRKIPPVDLMFSLSGRPYIDVRASFNSFIPAGVPDAIAERLVNAWLSRLDEHPELHDKVEFEIVHTTAEFGLRDSMRERYPGLLSDAEMACHAALLRKTTNAALLKHGTLYTARRKIEELRLIQSEKLYLERETARHMTPFDIALCISSAVRECRELGTIPFSQIARHAFIAEALLRTAVETGILEQERVMAFKAGVRTISGELSADFSRVLAGAMDKGEFLQVYGHIRPGTYDILSPSYAERKDLFDAESFAAESLHPGAFVLSSSEKALLDARLEAEGLETTGEGLMEYAATAIAGREYAKFVFSRHVSHILELVAMWGEKISLSREDLSMLPIAEVLESLHKPLSMEERSYFKQRIDFHRAEYERGRSFALAYLIRSERDVYIVPQHRSAPNFITAKRLSAPVVYLDVYAATETPLAGRIVCIDSADPGYDWIFTRNPAGLVTRFGGTNSHMAIRCAEYALPAAIGCGEMLFEQVKAADACILDCGARTLTPPLKGKGKV